MKRINIAAAVVIITLLLSSCGKEGNLPNQHNYEYSDNKFSYGLSDVAAFTVDNDIVYVTFYGSEYVCLYDNNGEKTTEYYLGEGTHTNLCFDQEKLYAFTFSQNSSGITVLDFESSEISFYPVNISLPIATAVTNEGIYMIYRNENIDPYLESISFSEYDNYIYLGEKVIYVDKNTFLVSEIPINNVLSLKKCDDNKLIFYAYDDIGGYYFTYYDTASSSFSEKIYNNTIRDTFSFDFIPENNSIIYSDFSNQKLISAPINESESCIDFMCNVIATDGNDLQYHDGYVYIADKATGNIFRTDYKDSVKDNEDIKILSPEIYSEVPYGCGYRINSRVISDEEFALSVLAGNADYDICMMSSEKTFSQNIRDKGAFYPLNDIPMVKEYLDKCFPYIKNAAYNSENEIWMLPIAVNVPCIVYSPENCKNQDINFTENTTWQYIFDSANRLYQNESLRDKYQINEFQAANDILNRYNSNYAFSDNKPNYQNDLFINYCTLIKENAANSDYLHTWIMSRSYYTSLSDYYNEYLFELLPEKFSLNDVYPYENLRAIPTPSLNGHEKGCAECTYFCVNANSENLTAALDFISTYCSYMLTKTDSMMFEDETTYPYYGYPLSDDLYNIYSDAQIVFTLPYEMFWDDYLRYINDEITLDEFIHEIDRKADMYLNE